MYAEERHQAIAELVASRGRVAVTELASQFEVTTETVRRDLSQLEKLELLRRVHGGAVSTRSVTMLEAQLPDRDQVNAEEKERIARAAVALLPDGGGTLLIDAGTTTARLAAHLPTSEHWTVITHAVPIAAQLAPLAHVELHLLPGRVRAATQAAVGQEHGRGDRTAPRRPRLPRHQRHLASTRPLHARPRGGRDEAGAGGGGRADRRTRRCQQGRPGAHRAVRGPRRCRRPGHRRLHRHRRREGVRGRGPRGRPGLRWPPPRGPS